MPASTGIPRGELPAERLREILDRLSRGYYDSPAVRDAVARAIVRDPELYQ